MQVLSLIARFTALRQAILVDESEKFWRGLCVKLKKADGKVEAAHGIFCAIAIRFSLKFYSIVKI